MMPRMCRWIVPSAVSVFLISDANADEAKPPESASPTRAEFEDLKAKNEALREEVELLKEDLQQTDQRVEKLAPLAAKVTGYLDVGFFVVGGDGSGIRRDTGFSNFPEYRDLVPDSWTFMGDPLSTIVNSRGEPATTGESRAVTFDSIRSKGPSFIVNSLNVGLFAQVASNTLLQAKFDVVPRGRDVSVKDLDSLFLGDFIDVRLAYVEQRIQKKWIDLSLFAGKFDSVMGFEYRSQEAPSRIEVTPSLICRYTCGYPTGVKARALFLDSKLGLNAAVTNGTHFTEMFPFFDETDRNQMKTGAARLHIAPVKGMELGVSGMFGAQDRQESNDTTQWMYGVDFHYHRQNFVLRGEFVQGLAKGKTEINQPRCGVTACLDFKGAYGLFAYRVTNAIMPYVRVDWRDALHRSGASFVYISELVRGTPGIRLTLTPNLALKAEYTFNVELGRIPQFNNDVFTSSLVITY